MQDVTYRIRISTLWLLFMVGFFAYRTLALSESATEVSLLANDEFATYLVIAIGFAYLSLVLPSRLARLANIIGGTIFGVGQIAMFADGITGYPDSTFNLMTGATVVITASIIWLALRWPSEAGVESREVAIVDEDLTERELHSIG
jgi:hypothetical protein